MPVQRAQATIQNLLASGNAIVIRVDAEAGAHRVETGGVLVAGKPRNSSGPFRAYVIGRAKGSGVVDYRAATNAFASQQSDAVIRGRRGAAFGIQALVAAELRAIEIRVIVIAASLKNDNIFSSAAKTAAAVPPPAPEPITQTSHERFSVPGE